MRRLLSAGTIVPALILFAAGCHGAVPAPAPSAVLGTVTGDAESRLVVDSAQHEVDVATLGVKLAKEEVTQARDRFQAGVANNIEVISAQEALARANDNQIAALYRYNQSRADLAHAIGQTEGIYSK